MKRPSEKQNLRNRSKKQTSKTLSGPGPEKRLILRAKPDEKLEALGRLGVTLEQMAGVPKFTHLLEHAENGLADVLMALRASPDPDAQTFIQKYDKLTERDLRRVSWEEICVACEIDTMQLFGVAMIALAKQGQAIAEIVAATAEPKVQKKNIQMALHDRGWKDREMFLLGRGRLPTPKGATIVGRIQVANIQNNAGGPPTLEADNGSSADEIDSMDDFIKAVHPIRVSNLLGDGS